MTKVQKQLAENIRYYRKQKGFTQEDLAEKAGTAANYIGTIEIGKKFPSPKMIEKIAAALSIDELSLFSTNVCNVSEKDIKSIEEELIKNLNKTLSETLRTYKNYMQ